MMATELGRCFSLIGKALIESRCAWDWYRDYFGRVPTPVSIFEGKATIAENAQDKAAAARGRVGQTGIGDGPQFDANRLLIEAAQDRYNQAVFYELGRNSGSSTSSSARSALRDRRSVQHRLCHGTRFYSMEATGTVGAPWDDNIDFDAFRHLSLIDILDRYLADPQLNWQNTLEANKGRPACRTGWPDIILAAAFFHRIRRDYGHGGGCTGASGN